MLARHAKLNLFADDKNLVAPGTTWGKVKDDCAKLELKDKLEYVNKLWNRKRYVSDKMNFKKDDYWQTPYQFSRLGGDCEDFAIAKLLTLQELGIEGRMLVVRRNGKEHAVCAAEGFFSPCTIVGDSSPRAQAAFTMTFTIDASLGASNIVSFSRDSSIVRSPRAPVLRSMDFFAISRRASVSISSSTPSRLNR